MFSIPFGKYYVIVWKKNEKKTWLAMFEPNVRSEFNYCANGSKNIFLFRSFNYQIWDLLLATINTIHNTYSYDIHQFLPLWLVLFVRFLEVYDLIVSFFLLCLFEEIRKDIWYSIAQSIFFLFCRRTQRDMFIQCSNKNKKTEC